MYNYNKYLDTNIMVKKIDEKSYFELEYKYKI